MAIYPPEESAADNGSATIKVDEEIEGEITGSRNYRFSQIGEPVPLKSGPESAFEPECLPLQPLAVSERFRLLFVAHSDGFCVARTKEVIASAEEFKEKKTGLSVQELSFVDVPIGKVSILALSADDSVLAATVGSDIHFYAVSALLHKDQKPSFSVSLDGSSCIRDMRWSRKFEKVYVSLSTDGKLYHGSGQGLPNCMMDNVDAVDWSVKGNFVAVARKTVLSIFSSQFKQRLSLSLLFKSAVGDSDANQVIRVDAVRWVRPDCIVVGCILLNVDGEEENYLVQVVTSKGGKITDASSKPIVLSFESSFADFRPDAVPIASGPHLFLSYLDLHGLAFIANRKNLCQHILLVSWSLDHGKNEAAMVDIYDDTWIPRIEYQENDEDNLILGLTVDKVSQNENVKLNLGEKEIEVSPCCVLVCLTIDGKISVFHFASAIGASVSSEDLADSSEGEDASHVSSVRHETAHISFKEKEESGEQTFSRSESYGLSRSGTDKGENERVSTRPNAQPHSLVADVKSEDKSITQYQERKPQVDEPKILSPVTLNNNSSVLTSLFAEKQDVKLEQLPFKTSSLGISEPLAKGFNRTEEDKSSASSFSGKVSMSNSQQIASSVDSLGKMVSTNLQHTQPLTWSSGKVDALKTSNDRSLLLPSHNVERGTSNKFGISASHVAGDPLRDTSHMNERAGSSVTYNTFEQRSALGTGTIHSLPANRVSQVPMQGSFTTGKSFEAQLNKESHATRSPTGSLYSEQNVPKQFSNVEEMANKLNNLLEGIERKGGFKDASVASQEKAVMVLENGIWDLSDRCRKWKETMDKQHIEVQLLLDKTVQVFARKIYVEGIFKQATDGQYWDLWNRQKLSPELELKRKHILDLDQELTNQMIELERHFNALEFNRFGENREMQTNQKAMQSWSGQSRYIKELHSLHNTMTAQLAAAEQLSECLSKQMAALNIESSAKKQDVKKKLFDSIGLSYSDASNISPNKERGLDTLSNKELLITSKKQSSRHQASFPKAYEPETVRRRRDSLDQSWARFEPPKTTVKRMLLHEDGNSSASRSLFMGDKQDVTPQSQRRTGVTPSALPNFSAGSLLQSKNREDLSTEISSPSLFQLTTPVMDRGMQVLSTKTSTSASQSALESTSRDIAQGTHKLTDEKSRNSVPFVGKNDSLATRLAAQTPMTANNSTGISVHDDEKFGSTKTTIGNENDMPVVTGSPLSESKFSFTSSSTFSSRKDLHDENQSRQSQPAVAVSSSTSPQSTFSSPLASTFNSSSAFPSLLSGSTAPTWSPATPFNPKTSTDSNHKTSQYQTSVSSSLNFPSDSSFSTPEMSRSSSISLSNMEPPKSIPHLSPGIFATKTEGIPPTQPSFANLSSKLEESISTHAPAPKVELSIPTSDAELGPTGTSPATEFSSKTKTSSQIDLGGNLSSSSDVASNVKPEEPCVAEAQLATAVTSSGIASAVKPVISDVANEDEMEEEAPETEQKTELAFGNLGGFGLGSASSSRAANSNPFGVAALNSATTAASTTFTMSTPSGELFRPASFNLQPLHPSQPLQPTTNVGAFSGGFNTGSTSQATPSGSGFGQPAQIGSGQQVLGSVLGGFGQQRQLGAGLPGSGPPSATGFARGFLGASSSGFGGGFATAATGSGFANLASSGGFAAATTGGGFGAAATGGGFAAAATGGGFSSLTSGGGGFSSLVTGGGFAGGGFAGAAAPAGGGFAGAAATAGPGFSGGGFGGFGNQQGGGFGGFGNQQSGFSAFGGSSGAARPPPELLTQMRK